MRMIAEKAKHAKFLTMVKRRKLRGFGCILMSSGSAKTILSGTVKLKIGWDRHRQILRGQEWTLRTLYN